MPQVSAGATRLDPYKNYKLRLWDGNRVYFGGKFTGLIPPVDVVQRRAGGGSPTPYKLPERSKYDLITLNMGVTENVSFSDWAGQVAGLLPPSEVVKYRAGGDPIIRKSPGRRKHDLVTLNRGITENQSFNDWANSVENFGSDPGEEAPPRNRLGGISLQLYDEAGASVIYYQIKGSSVYEFPNRPPNGARVHSLFPGDAKRIQEQFAEILESSLRRLKP